MLTSSIGEINYLVYLVELVVIPFRGRLTEGGGSRFREESFSRLKRVGRNDSRPHPRWFWANGITTIELQNGRVGRSPRRCATALVESVQTAILVVSNLCDPTDLND